MCATDILRIRATLDPVDRRLCEWAAEERRELMRLAVRFERRVGPAPKPQPEPALGAEVEATEPEPGP